MFVGEHNRRGPCHSWRQRNPAATTLHGSVRGFLAKVDNLAIPLNIGCFAEAMEFLVMTFFVCDVNYPDSFIRFLSD
jgi:hypothetical protein